MRAIDSDEADEAIRRHGNISGSLQTIAKPPASLLQEFFEWCDAAHGLRIAVIAEYENSKLAASVEIEFADQVFKFNQEWFYLRRREHVEQRVAVGNMSDEHRLGPCQERVFESSQ